MTPNPVAVVDDRSAESLVPDAFAVFQEAQAQANVDAATEAAHALDDLYAAMPAWKVYQDRLLNIGQQQQQAIETARTALYKEARKEIAFRNGVPPEA